MRPIELDPSSHSAGNWRRSEGRVLCSLHLPALRELDPSSHSAGNWRRSEGRVLCSLHLPALRELGSSSIDYDSICHHLPPEVKSCTLAMSQLSCEAFIYNDILISTLPLHIGYDLVANDILIPSLLTLAMTGICLALLCEHRSQTN